MFQKSNNSSSSSELRDAIIKEDWESVILICENHPSQARQWNSDGLPIHLALEFSSTIEALKAIIEAFPDGIKMKDKKLERLPLILSCVHCEKLAIMLLMNYPEAASKPDKLGRLPLHYACSKSANPKLINLILSAFPNGVSHKDRNGWLPIHVAIIGGASYKVIETLIKFFPASLSIMTRAGNLPIDLLEKGFPNQEHDEISFLLKGPCKIKRRFNVDSNWKTNSRKSIFSALA